MSTSTPSSIEHLIKPRLRDLGGSFFVRRLLPAFPTQMVGPFIFFDHFGPTDLPPGQGVDVRPHPHIGLATVTYLFEGEMVHRDSLGSVQPIRPGDVNWMTAGRGIVHSERTPPELRTSGSRVHGLQTWVALPREHEEADPAFFHHPVGTLPAFERDGIKLRVVAGNAFGLRSPVQTFSGTLYAAVEMQPGSRLILPAEHEERGVYLLNGQMDLDGERVAEQHLAVLASGPPVEIAAHGEVRLMLLGGERADGHRFIWWNFVSSSKERIEQAKADWRAQRIGHVPGETELIPLPEQ
jgi:redox-sensitive bicupin YhaK (pirin superfamily)